MRNDEFDRRTGLDRRDAVGGLMLGIIAAIVLAAALYLWWPWNGPRNADTSSPGTTVGTSTRRPAAPAFPTAPAPTTTR
jgi:hypothetical protein